MTTNNILTTLTTLKQYNNCDITLTFKDQDDLPCLTVCYVHPLFKIDFVRKASFLTFGDVDSAFFAIERAIQHNENTPPC